MSGSTVSWLVRIEGLCMVLANCYGLDGHMDACREAASDTCLETCRRGREALQAEGYWMHA